MPANRHSYGGICRTMVSTLYSMKVAKMHEDKYVTWTHMYKCIGNMHILTTKKKLTLEDIKGSLVKRLPGNWNASSW